MHWIFSVFSNSNSNGWKLRSRECVTDVCYCLMGLSCCVRFWVRVCVCVWAGENGVGWSKLCFRECLTTVVWLVVRFLCRSRTLVHRTDRHGANHHRPNLFQWTQPKIKIIDIQLNSLRKIMNWNVNGEYLWTIHRDEGAIVGVISRFLR